MDRAERGFSFTRDGPLDMRMGLSGGASAEQILNSWPEAELARVFRDYGEERHWRAYAARVVNAREQGAIRTTQQLCSALGHIGKTKGKRNKTHPATRIFQVLLHQPSSLQMLRQSCMTWMLCEACHTLAFMHVEECFRWHLAHSVLGKILREISSCIYGKMRSIAEL